MRKFFIVLAVLAIAATSCKKDENEAMAEKTTKDPIAAKLLDFKQTIQSHNKEVVLYNLEEAEWNLEGLLNFEESNNEHNWYGLEFESRTYEVPVSNGQISSSDLNQAYENFLSEINIILAEDENFRSDLVDISIEENQLKDGTATVGMTYSFGSIIIGSDYIQFGPNEYWMSNWNGGPCGTNPSTATNGAPELLEYKFNHPVSTGQAGYFTDCEQVIIMAVDSPLSNQNPAYPERDRMMYHSFGYPECLSPAELNFYLNNFDYLKQLYAPSGKNSVSMELMPEVCGGTVGYEYWIEYGIFHLNAGGTE